MVITVTSDWEVKRTSSLITGIDAVVGMVMIHEDCYFLGTFENKFYRQPFGLAYYGDSELVGKYLSLFRHHAWCGDFRYHAICLSHELISDA